MLVRPHPPVNADIHKRRSLSLSHDNNLRNARLVTWDAVSRKSASPPEDCEIMCVGLCVCLCLIRCVSSYLQAPRVLPCMYQCVSDEECVSVSLCSVHVPPHDCVCLSVCVRLSVCL